MKRGNSRPFTAPRASKPVETGHRKDNAEWVKRMERQLAQIEKRQTSVDTKQDSSEDDVPLVKKIQSQTRGKGKGIKLMSEREADETAKFGEVQRWITNSEGDEELITQTLLFIIGQI
jgi:hypothetical protein